MIVSIILPLIIVFGLASSTIISTADNNNDNDGMNTRYIQLSISLTFFLFSITYSYITE